ncbi:MAG: carbohydrate ABC transporter permease [Actinomycetia bacterium]|nr:carbohydrate ABC transporter permease [Actinomycetes bacterium]MCP4087951.1 carbohydrate ABC transporter permease [Actinomycetes bacterium]
MTLAADDDQLGGGKRARFPRRKKALSVGEATAASLTSRPGRMIIYTLMFLWTLPTFGVFISSFRPEVDVKTSGWWNWFTDPSLTLENYERVLSSAPGEVNMGEFFLNSFRITVPAVLLSVGIALLASYAFSWMNFKGRDWLFVGVVALLMVPLQMALIPLLQLFTGGAHIGSVTIFPDLNLTGSVVGVWIAHVAFGLPFCIFILKNFVAALPKELIESARVDGAGHATTFIRLVVPLSVPAIASLTIFQFMWIWNDYLIALIFAGRNNLPVTAKLAQVTGERGNAWHLLTASGMISMILPIMVFFALQRYFVRGLLAGAVKG